MKKERDISDLSPEKQARAHDAIKRAIEYMAENPPSIGDIVAHPDNEFTFEVTAVDDEKITVCDKDEELNSFSHGELFSVSYVNQLLSEISFAPNDGAIILHL